MITLTTLATIATLGVAGCVTVPDKDVPVVPTPTCDSPEDCNAKWDAAQLFVVHNADRKIQIATNVLIETYNPTEYGVEIAMRVTKESMGSGKYALVAEAWCANMFGFSRSPKRIVADFNTYIG